MADGKSRAAPSRPAPSPPDPPPPSAEVVSNLQAADDAVRELAEQLRRRREASWRLPPLADGYRDPLDRLRSAS